MSCICLYKPLYNFCIKKYTAHNPFHIKSNPYRECKEVTRSKQGQEALQLLDRKTLTLEIEGVRRLATPLLRHKDIPLLNATRDSVLPNLRSVERRLLKDPEKAETYQAEMSRLLETGAVSSL